MKTAMILAAGRGERLKPLTDTIPKSLCTINHVPLIEYHIERLVRANFEHIVINHAYLGGQIRKQIGCGARFGIDISFSPEPPGGLETGGGIFNALPLLGDKPFLTVNADIFTDYAFEACQLPNHSLVHAILVNKPHDFKQGDFSLSKMGFLQNEPRLHTFSGIACYDPHVFRSARPGRYSVTPLLRELAVSGQATGELFTGTWFDIGTLSRLQEARAWAAMI